MWGTYIDQIRKTSPLVHAITNYVTVNDVANIILAIGGQPIMADDAQEVEEITSICQSLVINIGTLNARTVESMILAGKAANRLGHPVILDPVGLGASSLRQEAVKRLLQEVKFTVIRGNISEIKMLMHYQEE
ncbi:MAG: hydroxyethylthiazole kinase, partial [Veillonella sp.]|nr:hydroxyethylthiazole kinase [Veillonella sp.]